MTDVNDSDVLAAVLAITDQNPAAKTTGVEAIDVAWLLDVPYASDLYDDLCRLARRSLVVSLTRSGEPVDWDEFPYEDRAMIRWQITPQGRFEVYRR